MPLFVTVTPGTTITSSTTLTPSTLNLLGTPSIDVTGSVDGGTLSVADGSLTLSKFAAIPGNRLIGNGNATSAYPEALSSTDLTFTNTTVNVGTGAITEPKLAARAATFAKVQAIATNRILGRTTASSGDIEELTVGSGLTLTAGTLNSLRPRTAFTNYEDPITYAISNNRNNAVTLTALNTSITPQTNTSKVLVQFSVSYEVTTYATAFILERVDGATVTPLGVPSTPGSNRIYGTKVAAPGSSNNAQSSIVISFLDSPASTNAITYRLRSYCREPSATLAINRTVNNTDSNVYTRATSQVILQEILPT
jgi:hypothetical protein